MGPCACERYYVEEHVVEDGSLFHGDKKQHEGATDYSPPQGLGTSDLLPATRSQLLKFPQPSKTVLLSGEQVLKM